MADLGVLDIHLHGSPVGRLLDLWGGRTLFEFDEAYTSSGNRPVLGLFFEDGAGGVNADTQPCPGRLMPFFSNLLPEGESRDWLEPSLMGASGGEFTLLGALGGDLPGAITARLPAGDAFAGPAREAPSDGVMRSSLPGMRMKFPGRAGARFRLSVPGGGQEGDWIIKPPSPRWPDLPENEYAMMELARKVGIPVPDTRLVAMANIDGLPEAFAQGGGRAFAARRFDRADGASIHMEDFAQIFGVHPERKYNRGSLANIAQTLSRANSGLDSQLDLIRRITFNALIGNGDAHLKDWSLVYPDGRTPVLAPAYGLVSTIAYLPADLMALKVSRSRAFADFCKAELLHLAERAALPKTAVWEAARETVQRFHEVWAAEAGNLPLVDSARSAIDNHLKGLPIILEA